MLETLIEKWEEVLDYLVTEFSISHVALNTWIMPLNIYSFDNKELILSLDDSDESNNKAKAPMLLTYIMNKYYDFILVAIAEVLEIDDFTLSIKLLSELKNSISDTQDINSLSSTASSVAIEQKLSSSNINHKYTFESFIVGSSNDVAQAASAAVADSPGIYNPLFIYGGAGLGKTHLMHAIGNYIISNYPEKKVLYTSSEDFTNELVSIIRNDTQNQSAINDFREKYRTVDVLLIDDIQFIIGKERTQEEFFHTFNTLYQANKQIVISSDKPPKDMELLEERLRTRFSNGLTVDIQKPDYETRLAILNKKADTDHLNIPDEVFDYIVKNITSNVRDLEGALTKIVAYSKLSRQPITLEFSENILSDIINPKQNEITMDLIIETVADHFQIKKEDICSNKKNQDIAFPRQICMYLGRTLTTDTYSHIASTLKKKDHSTVLHGYEKISHDINENQQLKDTIDIITKKINPN